MDNEIIATKLTEHENRIKVSEHRIEDLEEKTDRLEDLTLSVQELAISVKTMTDEMKTAKTATDNIKERLAEVEAQPYRAKAAMHDKYVSQIATLIIGTLVGFLLKTLLGI